MLISIKPGKTGFAQYATERPDEAFTIIEGNPWFMEREAQRILVESSRREISNYSYVLSFKEENLTKDQLYDYYEKFKGLYFKNYDNRELSILSVIHWDDIKPHIHVYVLSNSAISDKDLRQYRGYPDFKRVESVQEIINYQNNLASPFDNKKLFSLTQSQKKRDWLYKKQGYYEEVFDDTVERVMSEAIKQSKNFQQFLLILKKQFGSIEHIPKSHIQDKAFGEAQMLGQEALVFKDKKISKGKGTYRYESRLFNEKFFNNNLVLIQRALQKHNLRDLTFSSKRRGSLEDYIKMYETTTESHKKHLKDRKVGKEYIDFALKLKKEKNLAYFKTLKEKDFNRKEKIEDLFEKHLDLCSTAKDIKDFLDSINIVDFKTQSGETILYIYGKAFYIYSPLLYNALSEKDVSSSDIHQELKDALGNLQSNNNKKIVRKHIEELFYVKKIKTKEELEEFIESLGLHIKRSGKDKTKGSYLTFENQTGTFAIYNDFMVALYNNEERLDKYQEMKSSAILNETQKLFLQRYCTTISAQMYGKKNYIDSIYDYKLLKSPLLAYSVESTNKAEILRLNRGDEWESIIDMGKRITVNKSLDEKRSAFGVADMFYLKGSQNIKLRHGSKEFERSLIERIKEKGYPISLYGPGGELLFDNSKAQKEDDALKIARIVQAAEEGIESFNNSDGMPISTMLSSIFSNTMKSRKEIDNLRSLLKYASSLDIQIFTSICEAVGIEYVRGGKDKEKGCYVTFSYKDKRFALYDEEIYDYYQSHDGYYNKYHKKTSSPQERLKVELQKKAYRELDDILTVKKPINAFAQEENRPDRVKVKENGSEYFKKDIHYTDFKKRIDIHSIGREEGAAKELVERALFHKWDAIMVSDKALLDSVRAYVEQNQLPLIVYNAHGQQQNSVFLDTL